MKISGRSIAHIVLALAIAFLLFKIAGLAESRVRESVYNSCVDDAKDLRQKFSTDGYDGKTVDQRAASFRITRAQYLEKLDDIYREMVLECQLKRPARFFTLG